MVVELGVSVIFLSNGSVIRRRSLLRGVPRVGSPASSLLLRRSDFPAPLLRSLALRSAVPRHVAAETSGSLRFRGNPPPHAVLYDPGGSAAPGHSGVALLVGAAVLPSAVAQGVGTHDICYFEAGSHGLRARCLRFAAAVTDVRARLASGWWPTLAGRGSNPLGSIVRFPLHHLRFLLTQAWPDARASISSFSAIIPRTCLKGIDADGMQ
jgi:hypothetical protein